MLEASALGLSLALAFMVVVDAGVAVPFVFVSGRAHWCGVVLLRLSFVLGRGG